MKKLECGEVTEVTKDQYNYIMGALSGSSAGRIDNGKYFIKCWSSRMLPLVQSVLDNN